MTSSASTSQVIVSVGPSACHDVDTVHAYHRNFPEVKSEGESENQALERLGTQFILALEHVPGGHGRLAMEDALRDVQELLSHR